MAMEAVVMEMHMAAVHTEPVSLIQILRSDIYSPDYIRRR